MSEPRDHRGETLSREQQRLERLREAHPDGKDLANRVSSTSESTAELFGSESKPAAEHGGELGG